jgi:TPR repeat protein
VQEYYVNKQKTRLEEIKESEKTVAVDDGVGMFHVGIKYLEEYKLFYEVKSESALDCAQKAVEWFENGSKLKVNNYLCAAGLAYCYQEGVGKKTSVASAKKHYSKAEKELVTHAAEGDMYCAFFLSQYYGGVLYDWSENDKWLTMAAQLGHPGAQCIMANSIANKLLNNKDKDFDINKKVSEMIDWLNMAASQNYARGIEKLAYEYYWGKNIPQDKTKAKELYEKAAELGSESAMMVIGKHARLQANAYVF